jgi:hypothetical protein
LRANYGIQIVQPNSSIVQRSLHHRPQRSLVGAGGQFRDNSTKFSMLQLPSHAVAQHRQTAQYRGAGIVAARFQSQEQRHGVCHAAKVRSGAT